MVDVENHVKTTQIKWVNKIIQAKEEKLAILPRYWLNQASHKIKEDLFITNCSNLEGFHLNKIPTFYRNALLPWAALRKESQVQTKEEIMNENHCYFHIGKTAGLVE
jgi:hypothetical protein